MKFSIQQKIVSLGSLIVAIIINMPRLVALIDNDVVRQFWKFNLIEFIFQVAFNFIFCIIIGFYHLKQIIKFQKKRSTKTLSVLIATYIGLIVIFAALGVSIQEKFFENRLPISIFRTGYVIRLLFSLLIIVFSIEMFFLLETNRLKDIEHEKLRNTLLKSELELLKRQLNPHFFFNSLSSLSAIVREDALKAQHYIYHLSKAYRYSLQKTNTQLVSLEDELQSIESYTQLLKMRYEDAFNVQINVEPKFLATKLPHITLQPLIENAMKHNNASLAKPLIIKIYTSNNCLVCSNNLQPLSHVENSTGTGLYNLAERIKILLHQEITIEKTVDHFLIKIPIVLN